MIQVVAALIERDGRLLICQRRRGGPFALQWEFPGGKVRPGETPRAALARELREELGSAARIGRELHRTRHRYLEMSQALEIRFFAASGKFPAGGSGTDGAFERILWAKPSQLPRYDFLRADRAFVAQLAQGRLARWTTPGSSARRPPPAPGR